MDLSTTLTFRHVPRSGAFEAHARDMASRLKRLDDGISRCHMTLEGPPHCGFAAATYVVKIELTVPGARILADSLHIDGSAHASLYQAIRAAYYDARSQLRQLPRRGATPAPWHRH